MKYDFRLLVLYCIQSFHLSPLDLLHARGQIFSENKVYGAYYQRSFIV